MTTRKIFPIFVLFPTLFFISGCKKQTPPKDFGFILKLVGQEKISSLDSSYTLGYNNGGTKTVRIIFTDAEKKDLYNELISIDFESYPEDYKPECLGLSSPYDYYGLTVRQNNKTKSVKWLNTCGGGYDRKTKRYLNVVQHIIDITWSRKEVKNMPAPDLPFL